MSPPDTSATPPARRPADIGRRVFPLVALPALLGAAGIFLRSYTLGYPLVPRITERVWSARLAVRWNPQQAPVALLLPWEDAQQTVGEERMQSPGLETSIQVDADGIRQLQWKGEETVMASYEAELIVRPAVAEGPPLPADDLRRWLRTDIWPTPAVEAAGWLAAATPPDQVLRRCADWAARRASPSPELAGHLDRLRAATRNSAEAATLCLRAAGLPTRIALGFPLRAGIYTQALWLPEVFEAGRWRALDLGPSPIGLFTRALVWSFGEQALVSGRGGTPVEWQLELRQRRSQIWRRFFEQTVNRDTLLARWSLYQLPPDAQDVLRILLLVPVGALLAAVLRNVVGLNTFGTFMPILIAIAFRQTELMYGLSLFAAIIAVGYAVRLGLERFKLLLVPRLSAILTFVIGVIAFLALVGHHLATRNIIAVGLSPIVILTMTIERFHVVAEETGARAALGMNRRNACYIGPLNPRRAYPSVDNKRLSRRLAAAHDIPTPDLFGVVETHRDLRRTPALVAGRTAFVVKPARGAAGNGIVLIGSGTTTTAVQGREVVALHPDTRQPVEDLRVPHWERILTIAAQACEMTGLGYLGADLLIDRERGPLLLELNARPGLAVQLANRDGLHRRLGLVDRSVAPGMSVAERVALARSLFP